MILFIFYGCVVIPCLILVCTAYRIGVLIERRRRWNERAAMIQMSLDSGRKRPVSQHFQHRSSKQPHHD